MAVVNVMTNMLIEAIYDQLVLELITNVTDPDTKAGLIKIGKLQDDPTIKITNLMVRESEKPDIPHKDGDGLFVGSTYEVGGGVFYRRHFAVYMDMFFDNEFDRDVARYKAFVVLTRAERALQRMTPIADEDDFAETCTAIMQICEVHKREQGGEGEYIWKCRIELFWVTEIQV